MSEAGAINPPAKPTVDPTVDPTANPIVEPIVLPRDVGVVAIRECRHGVMAFLRADVTIGRALDYASFLVAQRDAR